MSKGACWKSSLDLHRHNDDETESLGSASENYGDPKGIPVGAFLNSLFEKQLYTDVDFAFKSKKACLSAHRVVLAAKSQFFAELLFGAKKNGSTGTERRIEIHNIPFTVFKAIVHYFYTDDIDFPDLPTVLEIHSAANTFKAQSLVDLCDHYINEFELTEDNACSTLQTSNSKFAHNLRNRCIEFMKNQTSEVISSPDFEKSSFNTVREITNLQDLTLQSESQMLEAVLRWTNVQPDHAKADLRQSLMKCIRFTSFTPKEFRDIINQHPELLTAGEALDTLIYLNDPTPKNMKGLPAWMNKSRRTFLQSKKNCGIKDVKQIDGGNLEIPLIASPGQQKTPNLTSVLRLRNIKSHRIITGIKVLLEDISTAGNLTVVIVMKAFIVPRGYHTYVSRTIDSKETLIGFPGGIVLEPGMLLNVEAQLYGCESVKFFQFDVSKEKLCDKFQYSVSSKPKQDRLYFLSEVLSKSMTRSAIRSYRRRFQKKKIKNTKETQEEKGISEEKLK